MGREAAKRSPTLLGAYAAGLTGVLLVLLFVLMSPSMVVTHPKSPAPDLAPAAHATVLAGAAKEDALVVVVTKDGSIYVRGSRVDRENLAPLIRDLVSGRADPRVYIRADARAKQGHVDEVLDCVRQAGITQVSLITEEIVTHK